MDQKQFGSILQNSLGGNNKEKQVKTQRLSIVGHLLRWDDVVIQISNISLISTSNLQQTPMPFWAIILIIFGVVLLPIIWWASLLCLALGILVIWAWYKETKKTEKYKYLNIQLNSGRMFSLLFENQEFLNQVLDVFANIFEDDNDQAQNRDIRIDIQNCHVDDRSNLNIKVDNSQADNGGAVIGAININKTGPLL
ncbi:hypothetical protein [uncultured Intestinimonas sp.]|uniref:hypothetical protein n=1 Tax=uncultured Intestinimonas sp. TaxID=1689265 RepID=UPI002943B660|nr:hypothetical protein [uncultured Intestinimonas sp.]